MLCPKDNVACDTKQLQDVTVDVCPVCDGVWLEKSEVRRLTRHFSFPEYSDVDELLEQWEIAESNVRASKDFWSEDKLVCTKDGTQMQKHLFAGSHIGVDQCPTCKGFWLDGGELHAVAKYFEPNPDLDKAWGQFVRDEIDWRNKLAEASSIPATIGAYSLAILKAPIFGVAVIGSLIVKMILERLIEDDIRLR